MKKTHYNIKIELNEANLKDEDWIKLAENRE
jgi:hypothetical protein